MSNTKIKAGQFSGIVGHGTDGYFLMTNGDGTMAWAEGGATGPSVTSVSYPGDDLAADPAGGQTVVLTGTGFAASGMAVSIGGTTAPSVAHDSNTQLTITTPAKAAGDYDIVVTNTVTGASGTFVNGISYNGIPTWTTAAGSLGTFESETTISTITLQATEPDGGTITFNITNGALPSGLSLTGANIDGTTTAESSTTLYSFTIEAIDDENQATPRNFSITVNSAELTPSENFTINTYTGNGSTQSIEGKIGTAASFNGSSSQIDLNYASLGMGVNDFSYSFWFKTNNTTASQTFMQVLSEHINYGVRINSTAGHLGSYPTNSSGGGEYISAAVTIDTDWHHVAYIKSSTAGVGHALYYDGTKITENTSFTGNVQTATDNKTTLGSATNDIVWFDGSLDQVRFFNKALSSSEVTTLYGENNTSSTKSTTDIFDDGSGVALYEFEEGAIDTGGVNGYIGSAGVFNGSSSDIATPTLIPTNDFTFSCWVNMNSFASSANKVIYNQNITNNRWYISVFDSGKVEAWNGANTFTTSSSVINLNQWHHIVYTADSTNGKKIYVDGTEVLSDANTGNNAGTAVGANWVGFGKWYTNALYLDGKLDQTRIFNKVLTTSEIATLSGETSASATKSTTDIFDDGSAVALYELEGNANNSATYIDNVHTTNLKINLNTLVEDSYSGGSTWSDLTTNGNDGTIYGATVDGDSLKFGAGDYVSIPDTADIVNSNFTIEVWFKLDSTTNQWNPLIGKGTSDNSEELTLMIRPGNNVIYFDWGTGGQYVQPSYTWQANVWYHFAMTFGTNGIYFWVNGQKITGQSANPGSTTSLTNDLRIGSARNNTINMYGNISQFRYYDSVLADNTIISNYNSSYNPAFYNGTATNVLYAYDGTPTNVSFVGTSFQPDFVWIKARDNSRHHRIFDSVRGENSRGYYYQVLSSSTDAQSAYDNTSWESPYGGLTSLDSNGFTVKHGTSTVAYPYNGNENYVAWCWKAADTTTTIAANTIGNTIASDVRANTESGFSIVKWTGTGGTQTVAHGLSNQPKFMFVKNISRAHHGFGYHTDINSTGYIFVTDTATSAASFNSGRNEWANGNQQPTENVFGVKSYVGNDSTLYSSNYLGDNYIAYCFHSVDGYQKVGSYTGNSSTTGPLIDVGFRPRFIMVKGVTSGYSSHWMMIDSVRDTDATKDKRLLANLANIETDDSNWATEFNDNGFQPKSTFTGYNDSSGTYIYLAIA